MAEGQENSGNIEVSLDNIGVPTFQSGLTQEVNDTYSYANNNLFYALVPTYLRDYMWRYVRVAVEWMDGYVPFLHQAGASGIMSTRLAAKLITGLTKQIVGEKIVFKCQDKSEDSKEALRFIGKWAAEKNILKAVFAGVGFALGIGTSLMKKNVSIAPDGKQDIWWEGVRFDRCFYTASFTNEVTDATFIIRSYVDTRKGKSNQQFFLTEHRYYKVYQQAEIEEGKDGKFKVIHKKGERVPMVEYRVHRCLGTMLTNVQPASVGTQGLAWAELPQFMKDNLKKDFAVIRVNEPHRLPFTNLGVDPLLNGNIDLSVPTGTNFGESLLVGIQSDLITYELAASYLLRDMYLAKGTVYTPKSTSLADINTPESQMAKSVLQGVGENKIEMMKGVDPETQKIVVEQFEIRGEEWQKVEENCLKNIGVKWGMHPKMLASFLTNGNSAQTATQIDSEDDSCIAFIYHTRAYFKYTFNKMLEETLNFYGFKANISFDFASPSLINKDRIIDRAIKQRDAGLMTTEDAVRETNPDLDEEVLQKKIDSAVAQENQRVMDQVNEMNDDGTFGEGNFTEQDQPQKLDGTTEILN